MNDGQHQTTIRDVVRLYWYNLMRRHVVHWRSRRDLLPVWVGEGRDPLLFPGRPGWISLEVWRKAREICHERQST